MALALAVSQPNSQGAWKTDSKTTAVPAAGVSFPVAVGEVALIRTGEASRNGLGIDDVAQYRSRDDSIFATAYVFLTGYADTALAALATHQAIVLRFTGAALSDDRTVAVDGVPDAAIRRTYTGGSLAPGHPLITEAAFVRRGRWMIVLRATGPAPDRAKVDAVIDGFIGGMRFSGGERPSPASPPMLGPACPVSRPDAKPLPHSKDTGAQYLGAAVAGGDTVLPDRKDKHPIPLAFPANGRARMCVSGSIQTDDRTIDLLAPAEPDPIVVGLAPINDAGGVVSVERLLVGGGYVVKKYDIGLAQALGSYEAPPSAAQLGAILTGKDQAGAMTRISVNLKADGNTDIVVDPDTLK